MDLVSSLVVEDKRFRVPEAMVDGVLADVEMSPNAGSDPTEVLVEAMGLLARYATEVAAVANSYQPHLPQSEAADAAVERLVSAFGERDEQTAARIGCLVQAHAATRALVGMLRSGGGGPPVATTRRVGPDGALVEVDLSDAHFGRGHHGCHGRQIALRLAEAATR